MDVTSSLFLVFINSLLFISFIKLIKESKKSKQNSFKPILLDKIKLLYENRNSFDKAIPSIFYHNTKHLSISRDQKYKFLITEKINSLFKCSIKNNFIKICIFL